MPRSSSASYLGGAAGPGSPYALRWLRRGPGIAVRLGGVGGGPAPPGLPESVLLVHGEVVREARHACVHLGAAEGLVVALLAGGHLDEGRAAEEHLGPLLDHDHVVGHAG